MPRKLTYPDPVLARAGLTPRTRMLARERLYEKALQDRERLIENQPHILDESDT